MIRNSNIALPLFAFAATLVAVPLAAQEPTVVTGAHQPTYQERVSFADLDLRQFSKQQTLKTRVRRAADRVCIEAEGPFPSYGYGFGSDLTCADLTYNHAKPQIVAAIDRARSGQQTAAMTLVISAPRAR